MLPPLTQEQLSAELRRIVDDPMWSVAVVLVSGDTMIGDLFPQRVPAFDVHRKPFAHLPKFWKQDPEDPAGTAVWLKDVELVFPAVEKGAGTPICHIRAQQVASIVRLGWNVESRVAQAEGDLATAISRANHAAAEKLGIRILSVVSASRQVPQRVRVEGIHFSRTAMLYADYDYLSRLASVAVSIGAFGTGAEVTLGISTLAEAVLRNRLTKGFTLPADTVRRVGLVPFVSDNDTVTMEGEEWRVALFEAVDDTWHVLRRKRIPMLLKNKAINYPDELWPFIRSPITVVGEEREIPLQVGEEEWLTAVAARIIGFVS